MGYTHYFNHDEVSQETWDKISRDCFRLRTISDVPIQYDSDIAELPVFNADMIHFNGVGDKGHETFVLEREGSSVFVFCKTARKPYDDLVTACLLIYHYYSPGTIDLSSDGDPDEWVNGYRLAERILGMHLPTMSTILWGN